MASNVKKLKTDKTLQEKPPQIPLSFCLLVCWFGHVLLCMGYVCKYGLYTYPCETSLEKIYFSFVSSGQWETRDHIRFPLSVLGAGTHIWLGPMQTCEDLVPAAVVYVSS